MDETCQLCTGGTVGRGRGTGTLRRTAPSKAIAPACTLFADARKEGAARRRPRRAAPAPASPRSTAAAGLELRRSSSDVCQKRAQRAQCRVRYRRVRASTGASGVAGGRYYAGRGERGLRAHLGAARGQVQQVPGLAGPRPVCTEGRTRHRLVRVRSVLRGGRDTSSSEPEGTGEPSSASARSTRERKSSACAAGCFVRSMRMSFVRAAETVGIPGPRCAVRSCVGAKRVRGAMHVGGWTQHTSETQIVIDSIGHCNPLQLL